MKKLKILSIILCIAISICFGLAGCSTTDNSQMFDETLPWAESGYDYTETCEYEFSRYLTGEDADEEFLQEGEDASKGYKLNSSGTVKYTLKEGYGIEIKDGKPYEENGDIRNPYEVKNNSTKNYTLLIMELHVIYKNDLTLVPNAAVRSTHAGKEDIMFSYSVIDRYTLAPVFTYKETRIGAQNTDDRKSYALTADYTGSVTGKKEARLKDARGEFDISLKDGKYFDSESIYYTVRAMRSVGDKSSRAFDLASPYDDLLTDSGKLKTKGAQQSTASDLSKVDLTDLSKVEWKDSIYKIFNIPEDQKTEEFKLNCYKTTLSLTETKSGPPIELYYSSVPTVTSSELGVRHNAKKILVMSSYENRDQKTNARYVQEFKLTGYTIK